MSVKSWRKEFYPLAASKCSKKNAAAHSLRKWRGTLPDALKRHDVVWMHSAVESKNSRVFLDFDYFSCALCHNFFLDINGVKDGCNSCPIVKATGNNCADIYTAVERAKTKSVSIRARWAMVKLLERTVAWQKGRAK